MQYPLEEKIGLPELLVGRKREFREFYKWVVFMPRKISKSRVILARRKSGKTSFIQRLYNQIWFDNGQVIPFFFDLGESKVWRPDLALRYFCSFASQFISFLERDPEFIKCPISLDQIREYGKTREISPLYKTVDSLRNHKQEENYSTMWETAATALHYFGCQLDKRFVVMLDEFRNFTAYVYPDRKFKADPIESMAGTFHSLAESKVAPMLVTGSNVGLLIAIMDKYLEAGRLSRIMMTPYLIKEEGLEAVFKYAEVYDEPVTNETAALINRLCLSDSFFHLLYFSKHYLGSGFDHRRGGRSCC